MAKPKVIAYLKPSCGWSRGVRAVLAKYGLDYEDKDIINNPEIYAQIDSFYDIFHWNKASPLRPNIHIDSCFVELILLPIITF